VIHTRRSVLSSLASSAAAATLAHRLVFAQAPAQDAPLTDPLRPRFHYLPDRNWMNDPCAPVFWRGRYHMFHHYNPHAAVWGDMHWAHAVSPDMVHWQRLPVAIAPTPGGPDSEGVFTGSSILHNGSPAILYTGVQTVPHAQATLSDGTHHFRETQLLATAADPNLNTWTKHSQPVIPSPPPGLEVTGFRDPTPFHHAGRQYLVVGSGQRGVGGMALLYRAPYLFSPGINDLTRWEYLHPLAQGTAISPARTSGAPRPDTPNPTKSTPIDTPKDPVDTGEMWECPDFFALGNRHVLIFSTRRKTFWQVGDLDPKTLRFHPTASGQLDLGRSFYAPKTQLDAHGNRILWGWLAETRPEADFAAAGWSGMLSLPRILTLRDSQLRMEPLPALRQLRAPAPNGSAIHEFTATLRQPGATPTATPFRLSDNAGLLLAIDFNAPDGLLLLDGGDAAALEVPIKLPDAAPLHLFFDNSVLELFLGNNLVFTKRHYGRHPTTPSSDSPYLPAGPWTNPSPTRCKASGAPDGGVQT